MPLGLQQESSAAAAIRRADKATLPAKMALTARYGIVSKLTIEFV